VIRGLLVLAGIFALVAWRHRRPRTFLYGVDPGRPEGDWTVRYGAWAEDWSDPVMDVYNGPGWTSDPYGAPFGDA
jgi:hypothetical protein